ncbi:hypothetical protein [uncultured Flavobacterium sp.]|uniref:tetratricopeptide repeat protein n=1 Tax=uncultured Flavobacterium sp. TaxID=165435 RepID=UPI0025D1E030|nr:hypothetical protein [uncultured Flavobacterium sp.]
MNKFYLGSLLFLSAISYSQVEKGSYVTNEKGQRIKLNIKENNKYELVVFYGDYEVKNDTLHFNNNNSSDSEFAVSFSTEANPEKGKVKVKLFGDYMYYYTGIYIGTQTGKAAPAYKSFAEFFSGTEAEDTKELVFEINREEFFYLAKEDYEGKTQISKFTLPRDANEIQIEYSPNYLGKVKLVGYLNDKKQLVVSENGKSNPLTFIMESEKQEKKTASIKPIETKTETNWTYPGKSDRWSAYQQPADSTLAVYNFKFKIESDLTKAIGATKKDKTKFLVINYDPDNKKSKEEFNTFIENQQYSVGSYSSYTDNIEYDKYNYYLANAKDKTWASKNKIKDNPSIVIVDGEGTVLSQTKGNISKNASLFEVYYSSIGPDLKRTKALVDLSKALNSKAKESEILKAFASLPEDDYYGSVAETVTAEPVVEVAAPVSEDQTVETVAFDMDYSPSETVYTNPVFDKKKILSVWENIVKNHAKDTKPNLDFVKVALAEIKGIGFYKHIFNEGRVYDEANFKAIDYLLKHYNEIIVEQQKSNGQETNVADYYGDYPATIDAELPRAISNHITEFGDQASDSYKARILEVYKKVLEKQAGDYKSKIDYFRLLNSYSTSEQNYVAEYDAFFNSIFKGNNDIEILDELYASRTQNGQDYEEWTMFKNYFSNASNETAWFVVEKSKNPESVKKAIKWSESSLRIEKNNPYYLDTLAQLYYKNGEKQKAISTQEQALKFSETMDEETKADLETVLEKMKNGSY